VLANTLLQALPAVALAALANTLVEVQVAAHRVTVALILRVAHQHVRLAELGPILETWLQPVLHVPVALFREPWHKAVALVVLGATQMPAMAAAHLALLAQCSQAWVNAVVRPAAAAPSPRVLPRAVRAVLWENTPPAAELQAVPRALQVSIKGLLALVVAAHALQVTTLLLPEPPVVLQFPLAALRAHPWVATFLLQAVHKAIRSAHLATGRVQEARFALFRLLDTLLLIRVVRLHHLVPQPLRLALRAATVKQAQRLASTQAWDISLR